MGFLWREALETETMNMSKMWAVMCGNVLQSASKCCILTYEYVKMH